MKLGGPRCNPISKAWCHTLSKRPWMMITANQTVLLCLTSSWSSFDSLKPLRSTDIVCSVSAFSSRRWTSPTDRFTAWWLEGKIVRSVTFSGYKDLPILCPTRRRPHLKHRNGLKLANLLSFKGWLCLATDIFFPKNVFFVSGLSTSVLLLVSLFQGEYWKFSHLSLWSCEWISRQQFSAGNCVCLTL